MRDRIYCQLVFPHNLKETNICVIYKGASGEFLLLKNRETSEEDIINLEFKINKNDKIRSLKNKSCKFKIMESSEKSGLFYFGLVNKYLHYSK